MAMRRPAALAAAGAAAFALPFAGCAADDPSGSTARSLGDELEDVVAAGVPGALVCRSWATAGRFTLRGRIGSSC